METMITSLQNPKIREARKLWKPSERKEKQLFLIEGFREITRAEEKSTPIETLFICPDLFLGENEEALIERIKRGAEVYVCSEPVFRSLAYRDRPDGLLAVARQFHLTLDYFNQMPDPFFLVMEGIEKPGNLGTILRSADAVGVTGVIVCDPVTDIFNPNVVRASTGTLFTLPVVQEETRRALHWLKERKIPILASTPSAELSYTNITMQRPLALVVGAEQYGLSRLWLEEATRRIKIPMCGSADSLNVAMAATLLLFEAKRQHGNP
jgi:RNA methyltransferase, TrmH family